MSGTDLELSANNPHANCPPTLIFRHRRENLKKCSLRGLETSPDLRFYTYPSEPLPDLSGYLLLKIGAPLLTEADCLSGLLLIDGTWRLARVMERALPHGGPALRSLPPYRTAYPRKQTDCPNPDIGLSSVEALYLAHKILKRPYSHLLDFYFWKEKFLLINEL